MFRAWRASTPQKSPTPKALMSANLYHFPNRSLFAPALLPFPSQTQPHTPKTTRYSPLSSSPLNLNSKRRPSHTLKSTCNCFQSRMSKSFCVLSSINMPLRATMNAFSSISSKTGCSLWDTEPAKIKSITSAEPKL